MEPAVSQARGAGKAQRPSRANEIVVLPTRGLHPWLLTVAPSGLKSRTFDTNGRRPGLGYLAPSGLSTAPP